MERDEKLLKDRKILRKIDLNLAIQSRFFVAANILLFLFVASVGGYYIQHPIVTSVWGAVILVLSAALFYFCTRFDSTYGAGPARWRSIFMGLQIGNSLCMGLFCAAVIWLDKLAVNAFLVSLYIVGYSALNNVEWSPYNQRNAVRLFCNLVPSIAAFTVLADINGLTIAAGLLVLMVMLLRQSNMLFVRHWDNVRVHHELHTKARDLAQAANEAHSASQFKTEFLSNITHEIRTPMNNVLGMLALLDDTEMSAQQRELQNLAVHSGEGLLSLIDDIVDFSRITSGQVQLNESVFHLKRCIDQNLELLGPRAHEKGMELSCTYEQDIPVRVKGDQARLAQLINNLVSNAIKYSDGTDIVLHVGMNKVSEQAAELRVSVKDNGKGIDPVLQDHLFEAFSKQLTTRDVSTTGTGLGLAISKGLAECMNGDIGFKSDKEGTEFWFTVCMSLSTQQAQKLSLNKELLNKQVLIVGAQGGVLEALVSQLDAWDMVVESVNSDSKAQMLITEADKAGRGYDLVFINMPVLQSIDLSLVSDLQHLTNLKSTPMIVMLSSLAQRADALRTGLEAKLSVDWLSKPVTREKLCRVLIDTFELDQPEDAADKLDAAGGGIIGRRILLVEDNAVNQMVAKGLLNKLGYVVTSVVNGKEALGLLEEKEFDLILMDCMMPVLDGYETTAAWREKESIDIDAGRIPIIAMTANVVEGEQQRCLACGMDDYLSKPVNIEELDAKMRQWLGGRESESTIEGSSLKSA